MQHHFREIVILCFVKSREKNRNVNFYPVARSRRDLKIFSSGVIFHGRHACGVQTFPAPQDWFFFFFRMCFSDLFSVSKQPEHWKLPVWGELGIFGHHRHVGHEKLPPMKRFSSLYDVWRRGKSWHYDLFLDFWPKKQNHSFAKMMLHYQVAKLQKNEKPSILRSWAFLDTTGMSAMKNDPQWKDFQVSTPFGGGVKGDMTILYLDFLPNTNSQFREHDVALRSCEITKLRSCGCWGIDKQPLGYW